jgi:DNA-binding MarR family transcriptional regulator
VEDAELARILRALQVIMRTGRSPRLGERIKERAGVETDRSVYYLLASVRDLQPVRLTDLAVHLGVDVSTVSRQVAHLEANDLVDRARDPDDGRASRLRLTGAGQDVLHRLGGAWQASVADLLADWDPARVAVFAATIEDFAERLGGMAEERDDG